MKMPYPAIEDDIEVFRLTARKMFVRVGKVDGVPDEGGKGGWWTVKEGVPDEGRPGRKGKSKRKSDADSEPGAGPLEGSTSVGDGTGPALTSFGVAPSYSSGVTMTAGEDGVQTTSSGASVGGFASFQGNLEAGRKAVQGSS